MFRASKKTRSPRHVEGLSAGRRSPWLMHWIEFSNYHATASPDTNWKLKTKAMALAKIVPIVASEPCHSRICRAPVILKRLQQAKRKTTRMLYHFFFPSTLYQSYLHVDNSWIILIFLTI